MIQKDYILRLIEEAAKVLAQIFKLKENRDFDSARKTLDKAYTEILKIDKFEILIRPTEKLITYLTLDLKLEPGKIEIISDFLAEDAFLETDLIVKKNLIEKSLLLTNYVNEFDKTFSFERVAKVKQLKEML